MGEVGDGIDVLEAGEGSGEEAEGMAFYGGDGCGGGLEVWRSVPGAVLSDPGGDEREDVWDVCQER